MNLLKDVLNQINTGNVSIWSEELVNITTEGESVLEIGCGSGASSLWLSNMNVA